MQYGLFLKVRTIDIFHKYTSVNWSYVVTCHVRALDYLWKRLWYSGERRLAITQMINSQRNMPTTSVTTMVWKVEELTTLHTGTSQL